MGTMNLTEEIIVKLSKRHFYDLLVFNNPTANINGFKVEIADMIILVDNIILCIQAKERNHSTSSSDEYKWFEEKVVTKANRQHKATLKYLLNNEIEFNNSSLSKKIKYDRNEHSICYITIFKNHYISEYTRYHKSETLGTYPIFSLESFSQVCDELMTPIDIIRFIPFRVNMSIQYEEKYKGSYLIEVKYDEEYTGFISDFSDPNLITMFVVQSELIDRTATMVQTKRFITYIEELIAQKNNIDNKDEINIANMVLSKYSLLDSRKIKDFFDCVDTVSIDISQYGIMDLSDGSKIIFFNSHYIDKDKEKMYYHFEHELFQEGIIVFADNKRIYSSYQDFRNVEVIPSLINK